MKHVTLGRPVLPDFGLPTTEPVVPASEYAQRLEQCRARMAAKGLQFLIVYGDREHFSNFEYLTGFDPRFEEALLIITAKGLPTVVAGDENIGYSNTAVIPVKRQHWPSFSLLGMPRDPGPSFDEILHTAGLDKGMNGGIAGWKYFESAELPNAEQAFETPAFLVDAVKRVIGAGKVVNASAIFMDAADGLRVINSVDQLARFEFAATYASQAVRNVLFNVKPGMSEYAASQFLGYPAMPLTCHTMLSAGPMAYFGLPCPSTRLMSLGEPFTVAVGLRGGLTSRAGFLVHNAAELPAGIHDYAEKLVMPYFGAIAEWYESVGIGTIGGDLYNLIHARLDDPFFGVTLTPGHLTHTEEWINSNTFKGSTIPLKSGMALQVDIIPGTGGPYYTANLEDTIVLADDAMQAEFAARYPEAWQRIQARKAFMADALHIHLKKEVLPFSNIPAFTPPYILDPGLVPVA